MGPAQETALARRSGAGSFMTRPPGQAFGSGSGAGSVPTIMVFRSARMLAPRLAAVRVRSWLPPVVLVIAFGDGTWPGMAGARRLMMLRPLAAGQPFRRSAMSWRKSPGLRRRRLTSQWPPIQWLPALCLAGRIWDDELAYVASEDDGVGRTRGTVGVWTAARYVSQPADRTGCFGRHPVILHRDSAVRSRGPGLSVVGR